MSPIFVIIAIGLFAIGFAIARHYFKHPAAILLGGLLFGAAFCALAVGIVYAGCMLVMKGIG